MSRSPLPEGRSPKRQKTSTNLFDTVMTSPPENVVDVITDGDAMLVVSGLAGVKKQVGLRVSSHILRMTSPVLKELLGSAGQLSRAGGGAPGCTLLQLPDDDGDTVLLLCKILHLRNDSLPPRLPAGSLYKLAALATRFECVVAVGRSTMQWFEKLYSTKVLSDTFRIIEAAYLLDEPTYFARFTERFIISEPINGLFISLSPDPTMRKLSDELHNRRHVLVSTIRSDLDVLIDPCTTGFTESSKHHIDYAPGMKPDSDSPGRYGSICHNDREAGAEFMGALREEGIFPPTVWPTTIEAIIKAVGEFDVPEYDDCDKCEFCVDVKAHFTNIVPIVKEMQAERLWGLCLDCFKSSTGTNAGECRYEHSKPKAKA